MLRPLSATTFILLGFVFFCFGTIYDAQCQDASPITGQVTDQKGEPLPGATVLVSGTSNGTVTDLDGNFTLAVSPNADTLKVSFVGYQTTTLPVGEDMNIVLSDDYGQLKEVVVVGYGALDRSDVVGSVSSVEVEEANTIPTTNVAEMLRGRAPGVQVNLSDPRPGGNSDILIRGKVSLVGNDPLIIVDGVPYDNLNDVPPEDITSMRY